MTIVRLHAEDRGTVEEELRRLARALPLPPPPTLVRRRPATFFRRRQ